MMLIYYMVQQIAQHLTSGRWISAIFTACLFSPLIIQIDKVAESNLLFG